MEKIPHHVGPTKKKPKPNAPEMSEEKQSEQNYKGGEWGPICGGKRRRGPAKVRRRREGGNERTRRERQTDARTAEEQNGLKKHQSQNKQP